MSYITAVDLGAVMRTIRMTFFVVQIDVETDVDVLLSVLLPHKSRRFSGTERHEARGLPTCKTT